MNEKYALHVHSKKGRMSLSLQYPWLICRLYTCTCLHPVPDLVSLNISTLSYFGIQQGDVLQWDMDIQGRFQEEIKSSRTLDIMITGMPGSGKTALINGLLGGKVGEEENRLLVLRLKNFLLMVL